MCDVIVVRVRLLEGHEYGGQCVSALDSGLVYSASLDRTLRSWDSARGEQIDCVEDHTDYVQCLCVEGPWVATGGQGDKKIMVYRQVNSVESSCRLQILSYCQTAL